MLSHAVARKPAPMLAMRPIGLRLRHGVDALGNAIGDSIASRSQGSENPYDRVNSVAENARGGFGAPTLSEEQAAALRQSLNLPNGSGDYGPPLLLAAGPGYSGLGRDTLKLTTPSGDDLDVAMQGMLHDIARDQAKQVARTNFLAGEAQATSSLYASGAGDVRTIRTLSESSFEPVQSITAEPLTPLAQALTFEVELPPTLAAIGQGVGDIAKNGTLALANMTVLPLADTVQAGLKFLHGSVTGDYQPLNSFSTIGAPGASTWDGLRSTAVNVYNISPVGMVQHSYTGARDMTTAVMNGDVRRATSEGLGLGLNFAGARAAGMGDYGFTITDVRGAGMGRLSQAGAIGIKFGKLQARAPQITVSDVTPGMALDPQASAIFRGGRTFTAEGNVRIDAATGNVRPTHGPSLDINPLNPNVASRGPHQIAEIPPELQIIQRGQKLGHFEVVPRAPMPMAEFQALLDKIVLHLD